MKTVTAADVMVAVASANAGTVSSLLAELDIDDAFPMTEIPLTDRAKFDGYRVNTVRGEGHIIPGNSGRGVLVRLSKSGKIVNFAECEVDILVEEYSAKPSSPRSDALYEELKEWRLSTSRKNGIAAYLVMTNDVLDRIVRAMPSNVTSLRKINGIGPVKEKRYGSDIVRIVRKHLR